jgi:prepilin-type N-terminal cleavage/methylation domain-containing protein
VRPARRARSGERGVTLVEMLVTVAVMTTGVAAMVGGFAGAERSAAAARAQSALTAALRTASDELRAAPYLPCAGGAASGYTVHVQGADAAVSAVTRPQSPPVLRSATGLVSAGALLCSAQGVATAAASCTAGPGETCDYGLQEVTVSVTSGGRTLRRDVWKGAGS